jgi:integrase
MSRIRLRYVQAFVDRKTGLPYHFFRRPGFPRVRLPGLPGSPEFMAAYQAAYASAPEPVGGGRSKPGSVASAIASHYGSSDFKKLAPSSQAVRRTVLERFGREHGDKMVAAMPTKFLRALLDSMEPTTAKNWLAAIRALTATAIELELIENDPTLGIKLRRMSGDGIHTWDEEQIAQFETAHPIGSRERLAFALGLYTGQRRGDVVRMGRQHIRRTPDGDVLAIRQQKTGKDMLIPIDPELRLLLDLVPATQMTFVQTLRGKPFDPHAFSAWFGEACDKAGLPSDCTFHGLRKAFCRRRAEAGCNVLQIAAGSGHTSLKEVERYTKAADQLRLNRQAMALTMAAETRPMKGRAT